MNKIQTLKGFRDFLPAEAMRRAWLRDKMIKVAEKWGYEPLETPTLEPLELFSGQIGEDEKLFFSFTDNGGRKVALRYDQTVPTCRVIGEYAQQLIYPFRRYQIQPAFRAEKPQKGRYREFTQFDLDIFGVTAPEADAEVIALTLAIYRDIGFKQIMAYINNRDLMTGIPYSAIAAIDKLKKIGREAVISEMIAKGISQNQAKAYLKQVEQIKPDATINRIFTYLKSAGFPVDWYQFEPTLARSFSYSQGPIWEIVIPEYGSGSVGGGERYDRLVEKISGQKIPGTGIGIGFDRTLEAAIACRLVPFFKAVSQVLVTVFNQDLWTKSVETTTAIRNAGIAAELYPDPQAKLDKQLKYASRKGIPHVIIIGPEETAKRLMKLKNMATKEQKEMKVEEVIDELK
jgi:histidyl-tRNA synthetase